MTARRRTVAAWTLLLWGPLVWTVHFIFIYGVASLALTLRPAAGPAPRIAIAAGTLAALALIAAAVWRADRYAAGQPGDPLFRFWTASTRMLCLISAVAVVWQALPAALAR